MIGALAIAAATLSAQLSPQMLQAFPGAAYATPYSSAARAKAARDRLGLAALPRLGTAVSVATPNSPYADDGSRLSIWKPSYVLGTPSGGEAAVNFWGIFNQGHVNVGFLPASSEPRLLDCRLLGGAQIAYKVYSGPGSAPQAQGEAPLLDGHVLVRVDIPAAGEAVSVELWPASDQAPLGFLGCEISVLQESR